VIEMDRATIDWRWMRLQQFASRYGLAMLCIAGPLGFGALAPDFALRLLLPATPHTLQAMLPAAPEAASVFRFLPDAPVKSERASSASAAAAKDKQGGDEMDGVDARDRNTLLGARDIGGRFRYAVASTFLCALSTAAFFFGAVVVIRRRGGLSPWVPWVVIAGFAGVSVWLAFHSTAFERTRPVIVESILRLVDGKEAWQTAGFALALVRINTCVVLIAVGVLLMALYTASLRDLDREPMLEDLLKRREIAHWVLGFGSSLLVVSVFASEILVDWPVSLLVKSQQLALKPIGEALTLLLGAIGTVALFAAMAPALAAFVLDVHRYRARTEPVWLVEPEQKPVAEPARPQPKPAAPADDGLGFAPLPAVTALVAAFAPLLASSVIQLLKGLLL
jgi:hypothetical protein